MLYADIQSYGDPQDECEGCCSYGVGKVNTCASTSQHSLCSCNCQQRQMVIRFHGEQSICGKGYIKIVIAIDGDKWDALKQLLDTKVGNNRTVVI